MAEFLRELALSNKAHMWKGRMYPKTWVATFFSIPVCYSCYNRINEGEVCFLEKDYPNGNLTRRVFCEKCSNIVKSGSHAVVQLPGGGYVEGEMI